MLNYPSFFNGVSAPYEIEQSLRFDGSSSFTRTNGTPDSTSVTTFSCWIKKATPVITGNQQLLFYGTFPYQSYINFTTGGSSYSDNLSVLTYANSNTGYTYTNALLRDPSAWYHIVLKKNGTTVQWYINGELQSTTQSGNNGSNTTWNGNGVAASFGSGFNGYIAEVVFVDNQDLDPTNFGEPDANGVWRPIRYTGTFGSQGWYLKFDPSATNGIGHDHSGNGNHWTPTGFDTTNSTASTYDVMSDTPTTNYATLNALAQGSPLTLSNGNLSLTGGHGTTTSTIAVTAGMKAYMEYQFSSSFSDGNDAAGFGVAQRTDPFSSYPGTQSNVWWVYQSNQWYIRPPVGGGNYGYKALSGNTVQIAIDYDAGKVWIGINNTWYDQSNGSSGDPAAGTGEMFSTTFTDSVHFFIHSATSTVNSVNFGQRAFAYTPPTGYQALNTANLPAPDIADGGKHFEVITYTGNGTARSFTGLGFQPDFVWIKSRAGAVHGAANHGLFDAVRGTNKGLFSSTTGTEGTFTHTLTSFDTDGFSLGTDADWGGTNQSSTTYVAWNWLAANGTSSNTDGSITSTVSANPSAGFSIATFTTTLSGSGSQTFGHGLGVAPSFVIVKARNQGYSWGVYHKSLGATKTLYLDLTLAANTGVNHYNNTEPTASVVTLGYGSATGAAADRVAYCFAEVEGYSKFGSYAGNGSTDGPFVWCGFRPKLILMKSSTNSATPWQIFDSVREPENTVEQTLIANGPSSEPYDTASPVDFLSNGFKLRGGASSYNNYNTGTWIFAAFAEHPFGGNNVSPATAR